MKKLLCLLFILVFISVAQAQQTYTLTGVVTDEKDIPIPGATVFLGDSRKATVSDGEGKFALHQVQPGKYNLVVKMIGYVITTHEFMLQNNNMRFRFKLPEDNVMLNTVEISGMSLADRKKHMETFLRCFFGTSEYAKRCKILNPDDVKLKFDKKTGTLTASSSDFLVIENKALGYRMKYLLNSFVYNTGTYFGTTIYFDGTLFFEDLQGSKRQMEKWEEARAKVYLGSSTHFFKSVMNNIIDEEGFVAYKMLNNEALKIYQKEQKRIPQAYFLPYTNLSTLIADVDENFKIFNAGLLKKDSLDLYVVYTPEKEPVEFTQRGVNINRFFSMPKGQTSVLRMVGDTILISKNGIVNTMNAVWFSGYWTWGQVSAFLPSDYEVPASIDPRKKKKNNVVKPAVSGR